MSDFILGLDLGQAADYSALIVVERILPERTPVPMEPVVTFRPLTPASFGGVVETIQRVFTGTTFVDPAPPPAPIADDTPRFDVRHIVRFPLGTAYPFIVDTVAELLRQPPLTDADLVIDGTGVGRAPVDMFRQHIGGAAVPVSIHGGDAGSRGDDGYYRVPKRALVSTIHLLLQQQRLRFARGLPLTALLTKELRDFKVKIDPRTAHDSYGAWRENAHDDLVLALALACWWGERRSEPRMWRLC